MKNKVVLLSLGLCLGLTACTNTPGATDAATNSASNSSTTSSATSNTTSAVTVKSCDETLTFESVPEKVLMLSETDAPILYDLGVLDHVKFRAGQHRTPESQADLRAALDTIPEVEAGDTGTGGAKMSTESILELDPDLVLGYDEGADREALKAAGIPLYSPDAMCANYHLDSAASFDLVNTEIDKMAAIFGADASKLKASMQDKLNELGTGSEQVGTAAALFVMPGSTEFYSYGYSSMIQPIFKANGLENVFAKEPQRVFDMDMETLLDADPEWIVLMADSPDPQEAREVFNTYPGVEKLQAVQKDQVVFLPFILTDPPTTLSVDGAVELGTLLKK